LGLSLDDPALQPPPKEWRSIILIDGLDEVSLGARGARAHLSHNSRKGEQHVEFMSFRDPKHFPRRRI
jgi:hypothetical protein